MSDSRIRLGISTCLLGEKVRFDGGHKHDRFLTDVVGPYVEWVPVCPELEIGMGAPREAIRLERAGEDVRLVGTRSGRDYTGRMETFSRSRVTGLAGLGLRGYILKKSSPSCGMERVKIYDKNQVPSRDGVGIYARVLKERYPLLPMEEEGRLRDPRLRENFITRIFAYDRWIRMRDNNPKPKDIVAFHTAHKMTLLAHSPKQYEALGRLVARAGKTPMEELLAEYEEGLMTGLQAVASPGRHSNVLEHFAGYLKDELSSEDKKELHGVIGEYRKGYVPLVTPLTLLHHHLKRLGHSWVEAQVYLEPYPRDLALRSNI